MEELADAGVQLPTPTGPVVTVAQVVDVNAFDDEAGTGEQLMTPVVDGIPAQVVVV